MEVLDTIENKISDYRLYILPVGALAVVGIFVMIIVSARLWKRRQYDKLVEETYGRFNPTEVVVAIPDPQKPTPSVLETMEQSAKDLNAAEIAV